MEARPVHSVPIWCSSCFLHSIAINFLSYLSPSTTCGASLKKVRARYLGRADFLVYTNSLCNFAGYAPSIVSLLESHSTARVDAAAPPSPSILGPTSSRSNKPS